VINFEIRDSLVIRGANTLVGLFPLTLRGTITLGLTAIVLKVYGYGSMDLVVFSLAICALAILIFSLFCAVVSGIVMQRRIHNDLRRRAEGHEPILAEAGFPNETGFSLPAPNFLPLVKLSWRIVYPDYLPTRIRVSSDQRLLEEIIPRKRCKSDTVIRAFTVSDVLGFCRYSWRQTQEVPCMVLPRTNTVKPLPLLRSLTAEDGIPNPSGDPDGDRMEIRPYVPGDSVRNIMWKVYARNRQLNVRLAEKSVFHSRRTVAYLLSSSNDEAAAAVARIALESGVLGENWAFAADGAEQACDSLPAALEALARSRAIGSAHAYGLDHFLDSAVANAGAHCIVFAGAELAPWLGPLKNTIARYSGQFSLVLATDGLEDIPRPGLWQCLFLADGRKRNKDGENGGSRAELLKLLTELSQLVESTLIVDRKTGLSFDHKLRKV
jgi:hypothetical protein